MDSSKNSKVRNMAHSDIEKINAEVVACQLRALAEAIDAESMRFLLETRLRIPLGIEDDDGNASAYLTISE